MAGLVVTDALGHNVCRYVVGECGRAEVLNRKAEGINAALAGIVAELELGLIHFLAVLVCNDVCVGICDVIEVCEACALLSYCVGQTIGVINDVCGGHHKLVDECSNLDRVVRDLGEILNHVLTDKCGNACDVRRCHGGSRLTVVALTGNRGVDHTAVSGNLGLNAEVGCGAPRGEIGHKGTRLLRSRELDGSRLYRCEHLAVITADRAGAELCLADVHLDLTRGVIINDDTCGALGLCHVSLLLEGGGASAHENDLATNVKTRIVRRTSDAGDGDVLDLHLVNAVGHNVVVEVLLFTDSVGGLCVIYYFIAIKKVGCLCTADRSYRHCALVGRGRADGRAIGVGGKAEVTVLLGAIGRVVAVGCRNYHTDTGGTDSVVNTLDRFLIHLTAEATAGTDGHIDNVNSENYAVLKSTEYPRGARGGYYVGEYFHDGELRVGCNSGDNVVLTCYNACNVSAVLAGGGSHGIHVGIVICVVKGKGNLIIKIYVGCRKSRMELVRLGVCDKLLNVGEGHTELGSVGCEIVNRKCGVVIVETGIENRNYHTRAVVCKGGAVEDTRAIHVNGVLNEESLAGVVLLTYDKVGSVADGLTQGLEVARLYNHLEAAEYRLVISAEIVIYILVLKGRENSILLLENILGKKLCLLGVGILAKGHNSVARLIGIEERILLDSHDYRYVIGVLHRAGKLVHRRAIKEFADVVDDITLDQLDDRVGDAVHHLLHQESARGNYCSQKENQRRCDSQRSHPFALFHHHFSYLSLWTRVGFWRAYIYSNKVIITRKVSNCNNYFNINFTFLNIFIDF